MFVYLFIPSFIHSFICFFIYSFICLLNCLLACLIHSFICSFVLLFIHPFIRLFYAFTLSSPPLQALLQAAHQWMPYSEEISIAGEYRTILPVKEVDPTGDLLCHHLEQQHHHWEAVSTYWQPSTGMYTAFIYIHVYACTSMYLFH